MLCLAVHAGRCRRFAVLLWLVGWLPVILACAVRFTALQSRSLLCLRSFTFKCLFSIMFLVFQVSVTAMDAAFFSVNSPLAATAAGSISGGALPLDRTMAHVYANIMGVSSSWSAPSTAQSLPATDAFVRPRAGLLVSAPGLTQGTPPSCCLFD